MSKRSWENQIPAVLRTGHDLRGRRVGYQLFKDHCEAELPATLNEYNADETQMGHLYPSDFLEDFFENDPLWWRFRPIADFY